MDRDKIVISLQKLINRHLDILEKEGRVTKHFLKAASDYDKLEKMAFEKRLQLKGLIKTKEAISDSIEKLTKIEENQKAELIRLNEQIKVIKEKYRTIENSLQLENYIDKSHIESAYDKRLQLVITKVFMKVHVDEHSPANLLRGFASNDFQNKLYPFEFEAKNLTNEETRDKLWEIAKQTTPHHSEWENLFRL